MEQKSSSVTLWVRHFADMENNSMTVLPCSHIRITERYPPRRCRLCPPIGAVELAGDRPYCRCPPRVLRCMLRFTVCLVPLISSSWQFCDTLEVKDGVSAGPKGWGLDYALQQWGAWQIQTNTACEADSLTTVDIGLIFLSDSMRGPVRR